MMSISDGAVYGSTSHGHGWALDMDTGKARWVRQVGTEVGGDQSNIQQRNGIVIIGMGKCRGNFACDNNGQSGNPVLHGLNATDGRSIWEFMPDWSVWNFYIVFPDEDTFVYQDLEGRVYRNRVADGTLIW